MRFKFHKNAVAYTDKTAKVFFNKSISLPKKEKQHYVKIFNNSYN